MYITVSGSSGTWTVGNFISDDTTGATGKIRRVVGSNIYVTGVRGGTFTATNGVTEYTDRELQSAADASAVALSCSSEPVAWVST